MSSEVRLIENWGCQSAWLPQYGCVALLCRAGWVVHQAGEAGYALEQKTSPVFAAMQIYKASGYVIFPCRFFDNNEKALEDMKKLAELQTGGAGK